MGRFLGFGAGHNVYRVVDSASPDNDELVLKVAVDGEWQLENERNVLKAMDGVPGMPRYVAHGRLQGCGLHALLTQGTGTPLSRLIVTGGCCLQDVLRWLQSAEDILRALHRRGFVHGDLKPEHILINARGPLLIDFGSSVRIGDTYLAHTTGWTSPSRGAARPHDDFAVLEKMRAHAKERLSNKSRTDRMEVERKR